MCNTICGAVPDFTLEEAYKGEEFDTELELERQQAIAYGLRREKRVRKDPEPEVCALLTYDAENKEELPGKLKRTDKSKKSGDDQVDRAHFNAEVVRAFFKECLFFDSLDNKNVDIRSVANYGDKFDNAYMNPNQDGEPIMVYGSGNVFLPFANSLDVAGHEMGHAYISFTSELPYVWEFGALNEHLADVIGETCEQRELGVDAENASWLMGEALVSDALAARGFLAIRNFDKLKASEDDPQQWDWRKRYRGPRDNGGVHYNSKSPNVVFKNFACLIEGKTHKTAFEIWRRTNLEIEPLTPMRTFANTTLEVCKKDRDFDKYANPLQKLWQEVNVL